MNSTTLPLSANYQIYPDIASNPHNIHGIDFFVNRSSCISHFENASLSKRAISFIKSCATFFAYVLHTISLVFRRVEAQMQAFATIDRDRPPKKRLVVCLHGLNNNPSQFKTIVDSMQQKGLDETDIFIPKVLQKGNAKLDEMVKPILEEISRWAKTPGDRELVLVGISNGGRISRAIEAELTKSNGWGSIKKCKAISIVGANKGSSLVNFAKKLGLSCLLQKNISEEMPTDSESIVKLNKDWTEGLKNSPEVARDHTYIASPHDWQVPNYESTLPELNNLKVRYAIVPGHGHNSIVNAVAKAVADIILA